MLAKLVTGYMAKQSGAGNAMQGAATPGLASMLDLNGDGNTQDDIMRMAGKAMR